MDRSFNNVLNSVEKNINININEENKQSLYKNDEEEISYASYNDYLENRLKPTLNKN